MGPVAALRYWPEDLEEQVEEADEAPAGHARYRACPSEAPTTGLPSERFARQDQLDAVRGLHAEAVTP